MKASKSPGTALERHEAFHAEKDALLPMALRILMSLGVDDSGAPHQGQVRIVPVHRRRILHVVPKERHERAEQIPGLAALRPPRLRAERACLRVPEELRVARQKPAVFGDAVRSLGLPTGHDHGFTLHSFQHFFENFTVNERIPQLGHRSTAVYCRLKDENRAPSEPIRPGVCHERDFRHNDPVGCKRCRVLGPRIREFGGGKSVPEPVPALSARQGDARGTPSREIGCWRSAARLSRGRLDTVSVAPSATAKDG